ncbi:Phosphatidylglycerol/phosphatidylinositol transfer protein [Kappamyces sp. JEL0829]|nr:Phosphatidylglycerol/phosphatidylinositol transfer protein [Kappamyces sp. JEL0829]
MQFAVVASLLATLSAALPSTQPAVVMRTAFNEEISPLSWCGDASDVLTLKDVVLTPYPVQSGKPLVVSVAGSLSEDIVSGASAHVVAKLGFIPVLTTDIDICGQVPGGCPLDHNNTTQLSVTQNIPGAAPAGSLSIQIDVKNGNGKAVACLKGKIQIVKA